MTATDPLASLHMHPPFPRPPLPTRRPPQATIRLWLLRLIGSFYARPPSYAPSHSLLLIRPDHLGDLLFVTPALHQLRLALPTARITMLVGPWSRRIVEGNEDVDAVLDCRFPGFERRPKTSLLAPYRLLLTCARRLRGQGYDVAVVLRSDHWWGAWLAAAAGIPRRIGYDLPETRPFLTERLPYSAGRHEVQQNATLLARLAPALTDDPGPTRFTMSEGDRAWADAWLAAHGHEPTRPLVAIHPGAGAPVKQWPLAAWAFVADRLAQTRDATILLTGSAGEQPLVEALASAMQSHAINAAGQTTLGQLAALYAHCALVLGPDSGPLHLAVAVGAATIHLFGPAAAHKFGPWGDPARHIVLRSHWPCVPCERLDWPASTLAQHACVAAISPTTVLNAALQLI